MKNILRELNTFGRIKVFKSIPDVEGEETVTLLPLRRRIKNGGKPHKAMGKPFPLRGGNYRIGNPTTIGGELGFTREMLLGGETDCRPLYGEGHNQTDPQSKGA